MLSVCFASAIGFALVMNIAAPMRWRVLLGFSALFNGLSAALWLY